MKKIQIILIAAFLLLPRALPLFCQTQSLSDLDRETTALAERIFQYALNTGRTMNIEIGAFGYSGTETPLGNYWQQNLVTLLADKNGVTVVIPGPVIKGEYALSGEILDLGRTVRVFTRLVDKTNSTVLASWTNDLDKTPFLENLFAQDSSERSTVLRDEYEDDSWENPVPVTIDGTPLVRTIHQEDRDWFLIIPEKDILASLETSGSMDTYMELYDEERNKIAEDDDSGEGENARIVYSLEEGKSYIAMVRGYSSETGNYQFFVRETELPDQAIEPNDTLETAFPIELGNEIRAHLAPNDPDWYSFSLRNSGYVRIITRGRLDKQLALYDAGGRELVMIDDSESNDNAIIFRFLENGTYYLFVKGHGKNIVGSYALLAVLRENVELDSYEPDDDPTQAKEIRIGETQRHSFTDGYDMDWVFFNVDVYGRYRISAKGEKSDELDTKLELYDENLKLLDTDDDGGPGYSSLLFQSLNPGKYYIKVKCLDDDPEDTYLLGLEREVE